MKKIRFPFLLVLFTLAQVRDADAQASDSLTGAWDYAVDTGQGETGGTLTLTGSSDELSGTMTGDDGQTIPLSDITPAGDTLSFKFTTNGYGSGTGELVFSGDTFEGQMNLPSYGRFPLRGRRQVARSDSATFSTRTPLRELFESEEAKAVLEEHVPGITTNPQLQQALHMSLRDVAPFAPDYYTEEKLQAIDEDLAKL